MRVLNFSSKSSEDTITITPSDVHEEVSSAGRGASERQLIGIYDFAGGILKRSVYDNDRSDSSDDENSSNGSTDSGERDTGVTPVCVKRPIRQANTSMQQTQPSQYANSTNNANPRGAPRTQHLADSANSTNARPHRPPPPPPSSSPRRRMADTDASQSQHGHHPSETRTSQARSSGPPRKGRRDIPVVRGPPVGYWYSDC